jgi:hypothetical protein
MNMLSRPLLIAVSVVALSTALAGCKRPSDAPPPTTTTTPAPPVTTTPAPPASAASR